MLTCVYVKPFHFISSITNVTYWHSGISHVNFVYSWRLHQFHYCSSSASSHSLFFWAFLQLLGMCQNICTQHNMTYSHQPHRIYAEVTFIVSTGDSRFEWVTFSFFFYEHKFKIVIRSVWENVAVIGLLDINWNTIHWAPFKNLLTKTSSLVLTDHIPQILRNSEKNQLHLLFFFLY